MCHATKPYGIQPQQFDENWTISKGNIYNSIELIIYLGIVDANEHPIDAASRELKEETSIDLENDFKDLIPNKV